MPKPSAPIWNPALETLPRARLEKLQLTRFQELLAHIYRRIPHYRRVLDERGIDPSRSLPRYTRSSGSGQVVSRFKSLAQVAELPFTTKQDLRNNYPFGLCTMSPEKLARIHASSGTTGKPTVGAYNKHDLGVWAEVMARTLTACGVSKRDIVHNAYGYGLFTGGLGFHLGAEKIGATVVPVSGGLSKRQITLMQDFGATVLTCTPSYALVLAETAREMGVDFSTQMQVRVGIFGAEPWTEEMRREIQTRLNLEAFDIYGLTEIIGPGVAVECPAHDGLHIFEDHFYAEVIDPETGAALEDGATGELVFTTLTKQAMPVLRYRTRDRVTLTRAKCACGRTLARMSKVHGRTDDMLIVRGVNVFPSQIEQIILAAEGIEPQYLIILNRPRHELDTLDVWIEATPELWARGEDAQGHVQARLYRDLQETLGLAANVSLRAPNSIPRSEGKANRVMDKREIGN